MNERRIATFTHSKAVIADVDGDGKMEIVLHTYLSGVTVYDLD